MKDYKIVSLEMCESDNQISRVFNYIWPERFLKRKLKYYSSVNAGAITCLIQNKLKEINEKIIVVYGTGSLHHYTYGLYKNTEKRFGECCYWHFDKHSDWGSEDAYLGCGSFVHHLIKNSLSQCVRAVGNNVGADNWGYPFYWPKYKGLGLGRKIFNRITKREIRDLIKDSNERAYLSFDLDVMDKREIITDYNHGSLKTSNLLEIINTIKNEREIIGTDILGYPPSSTFFDAKSLVLYLIIAGKLLDEDVKEFMKLHNYLKKKDDVKDIKSLLSCLGVKNE